MGFFRRVMAKSNQKPEIRDAADHRPGYDAFLELRPLHADISNAFNLVVLAALWSTGALHDHPALWLQHACRLLFLVLTVHFASALAFQGFASRCGTQIQTSPSAQKEHVMAELFQTVLGFGGVLAPLLAWAAVNAELGRPTAWKSDIDECIPGPWSYGAKVCVYSIGVGVGAFLADTYNYWKHRVFHTHLLWPFHRHHHAHRNPSALTGYAISPVYSIATFWPLGLSAFPEISFFVPIYGAFTGFYFLLNHYLHCGYVIWWLELPLAPLGIMTSNWHNTHHNRGRRGFNEKDQTFGEMTTRWDVWMYTYPKCKG